MFFPVFPAAAQAAAAASSGQQNKRLRKEKDELQTEIFVLFNRKLRWTIRDLCDMTEQPMQWLREVLAGVATQVKAGPDKGTWELMPKFKLSEAGGGGPGPG